MDENPVKLTLDLAHWTWLNDHDGGHDDEDDDDEREGVIERPGQW